MKVGVVGAGAVGAACIMAIIGRGGAHEIVVIDTDEGRVRGLVTDMQYGTPLCPPVRLFGGVVSPSVTFVDTWQTNVPPSPTLRISPTGSPE